MARKAPPPVEPDHIADAGNMIKVEETLSTVDTAGDLVVTAYLIKAKRDGYRRAGRAWSKTETRVEAADLTVEQVAAILADPRLDVVMVAE